ncbi:hypothetical protein [Raineya sp.]
MLLYAKYSSNLNAQPQNKADVMLFLLDSGKRQGFVQWWQKQKS